MSQLANLPKGTQIVDATLIRDQQRQIVELGQQNASQYRTIQDLDTQLAAVTQERDRAVKVLSEVHDDLVLRAECSVYYSTWQWGAVSVVCCH